LHRRRPHEYYWRDDRFFGMVAVLDQQHAAASVPLPTTFVDQANSVNLPANVAIRNVQYRSDHILNLNF
jgi:hypothetical protein